MCEEKRLLELIDAGATLAREAAFTDAHTVELWKRQIRDMLNDEPISDIRGVMTAVDRRDARTITQELIKFCEMRFGVSPRPNMKKQPGTKRKKGLRDDEDGEFYTGIRHSSDREADMCARIETIALESEIWSFEGLLSQCEVESPKVYKWLKAGDKHRRELVERHLQRASEEYARGLYGILADCGVPMDPWGEPLCC